MLALELVFSVTSSALFGTTVGLLAFALRHTLRWKHIMRTLGWHYLSNATCPIRPHLFYAFMRVLSYPGSPYFATLFVTFEERLR